MNPEPKLAELRQIGSTVSAGGTALPFSRAGNLIGLMEEKR